jgi:hypothetical protein
MSGESGMFDPEYMEIVRNQLSPVVPRPAREIQPTSFRDVEAEGRAAYAVSERLITLPQFQRGIVDNIVELDDYIRNRADGCSKMALIHLMQLQEAVAMGQIRLAVRYLDGQL